jgi:hypothetical protein
VTVTTLEALVEALTQEVAVAEHVEPTKQVRRRTDARVAEGPIDELIEALRREDLGL